jgi:hypothetical protein
MWGKLTERNNRTKTKMISEPQELYRCLARPGIKVMKLIFTSGDIVWMLWRLFAEEKVPSLSHTNEVNGAYVTDGARINLYRYLEGFQEKASYCDTDSVFYIQKAGQPRLIECEDNLGDRENKEFVSESPKNYAYKNLIPLQTKRKPSVRSEG